MKTAFGITVALACVAAFGFAVNRSIEFSAERQTMERQRFTDLSAMAAAANKRVNEGISAAGTRREQDIAAEQAKVYERPR